MSVCPLGVIREEPAEHGMSLSPGMPSSDVRSSSRIMPARMLVSPSFKRICVVSWRLANVGRPAKPLPETLLRSIFTASVTSSFGCVRGVMSRFTPMFS